MKLKTCKDIYQFPLSHDWGRVRDAKYQFVFQFESKFDKEGNFAQGWKEFENRVVSCLNGNPEKFKHPFEAKDGEIFTNGIHVMTIRGWGNLTGIGAHNLPHDEAANIQDTFCQFIIETLNTSQPPQETIKTGV